MVLLIESQEVARTKTSKKNSFLFHIKCTILLSPSSATVVTKVARISSGGTHVGQNYSHHCLNWRVSKFYDFLKLSVLSLGRKNHHHLFPPLLFFFKKRPPFCSVEMPFFVIEFFNLREKRDKKRWRKVLIAPTTQPMQLKQEKTQTLKSNDEFGSIFEVYMKSRRSRSQITFLQQALPKLKSMRAS